MSTLLSKPFYRKFILTAVLLAGLLLCARSQETKYAFRELYQLDSIGKSQSFTRHFGKLYYDFLLLVEAKLVREDTTSIRLVRHFEMVFADFYINACIAYSDHKEVPLPAWRTYFASNSLQAAQYYLLGANAHLNGGLAEAIAGAYSPEDWKLIKGKYGIFNSCLNQTYDRVYRETLSESGRVRALHVLTFGLDKLIGRYYLYKWRRRQMRLTEYFYAGSPEYSKLLKRINRKKERIDRMVFNQL